MAENCQKAAAGLISKIVIYCIKLKIIATVQEGGTLIIDMILILATWMI